MSSTAEWIRPADVIDGLRPEVDRAAVTDRLTPEERANQITHGLGFLLSVVGIGSLLPVAWDSSDPRVVYGCTIYAASLVLLYAASMLSHSFADGRARDLFRLLDQVCIYFLIAGTVTPMALVFWSPWMLVTLLLATWVIALFGMYRKVFVEGPNKVSLGLYVVLGWLPVAGIGPILHRIPQDAGLILVAGGLCYTIGTYFWLREGRIPYSHAVWHLFVLLGTAAHFAIIRWYVAEAALAPIAAL